MRKEHIDICRVCMSGAKKRGDAALGDLQKDTWPQRSLYNISVPGEGSHDVTATPTCEGASNV
jgi:hypothetical protein